jgi:serine protease
MLSQAATSTLYFFRFSERMHRMNSYKKLSFPLLFVMILIALFIWGIHRRGYFLPGSVSVAVDTKITPAVRTISGIDNEPPRPVAALSDGRGTTISFVEDELIYTTDDKVALEAFVKRWGGTVVRHLVPVDAGLRAPSQHLVRINARSANTKQMVSDLKKLNPGRSGNLIVSSDAGLALVAIASHEAAAGYPIGINFVLSSTGYSDKNLMEGMPPASGSASPTLGIEIFNRNPDKWSYFVRGSGTQNIGVGDAWRALDQVGRLKNKVKIAVIDGGFLSKRRQSRRFRDLHQFDLGAGPKS